MLTSLVLFVSYLYASACRGSRDEAASTNRCPHNLLSKRLAESDEKYADRSTALMQLTKALRVQATPKPTECNSCQRIDSRSFNGNPLSLQKPVIFTHILDGSDPGYWRNWSRSEFVRNHGNVTFSTEALDHNGAGDQILALIASGKMSSIPTLAQILEAGQPGNFFVGDGWTSKLLPRPDVLPAHARGLLEPGVFSGISMGSSGQWNEVHIHQHSILTQVKGSKRWVLAPPDSFPDGKRVMEHSGERNLRHLTKEDVCTPTFSKTSLYEPEAENSARWNLTQRGMCCDAYEGEAVFIPGMTRNGGWWHGTCDLQEWNVAFVHIR